MSNRIAASNVTIVKIFTGILMAGWTIAIAISTAYTIYIYKEMTLRLASMEAKATFNKDNTYRLWAVKHGGVYVPVTKDTPPNPYLVHIPERDIVTPSGRVLTLMNSAYMLRQIHGIGSSNYGTRGHLFSLNPIRPGNSPDRWEAESLQKLMKEGDEVFSTDYINGKPYLRYLKKLITDESCLKCHLKQGYKIGDVRGGISVSVPLLHYRSLEMSNILSSLSMHGIFLFLGIAGLFIGSLIFVRAIKKRDQIAEALRESEERYRMLAETSPDMIFITDQEGIIRYVNKSGARAFNRQPDNLIGKNQLELFPPQIAEQHRDSIKNVFRSGEIFSSETEIIFPSNKMWIENRLVPLRDTTGNISGILGISRDITHRKRLNDALLESEERYKIVTSMTSDYMFIVTIGNEGNVVLSYVSDNYGNITGRTIDEMITPAEWKSIIHPDDRDCFMQFFKEHMESDQPGEIECRSFVKSGRERWIQIFVKPKIDEKTRRPYMIVGAVKDITERKRAEEALKSSLNEKEILLKEIHHRVKNNLQIISSLLSLQIERINDEHLLQEFHDYRNRVNTMAMIHEKLYQSENYSNIDFSDYITTLADELISNFTVTGTPVSHDLHLEKVDLTINQAIPCGLIINEVITNSIKYAFPPTWKGSAKITILLHQDTDNTITLQISDNGIGFSNEHNFHNAKTLGLSLIDLLTRQIDATLQYEGIKGASYTIKFMKQ